jgi:hypothetical protein
MMRARGEVSGDKSRFDDTDAISGHPTRAIATDGGA